MIDNSIQVTPLASQAIESLRHPAGTLDVYRTTLTRLFNSVLHFAEDFGMDDAEALNTLRALDMIRRDLTAIAEIPDPANSSDEIPDPDHNPESDPTDDMPAQ
ncbi:MAG: hypothetical protein K2H98_02385 [Duncaniella sp.]|nr:hypothetical protein [Duncaniella sp.]